MLLQQDKFEMFDQGGGVEQFVIQVPTITTTMNGQTAKDIFDRQPEVEGIVVMENDRPAGIIMRTAFFQSMGTLYGHSLYLKRPVSILMDSDFMKIDITGNISKIGIQAMNRAQGKLYDYLVVYRSRSYIGIISIRQFLIELSKRNEAQISVLKGQQQKLLSANKQEIELRKSLEYQSASVRNLLDHADQGFLWFGGDLVIKQEYSYKCRSIFKRCIGDQSFLDLVEPYFSKEKAAVFQEAFESYFQNNDSVTDHVYLLLLPSDCLIFDRTIHFEYRRIESNGEKAVMVILSDITEKITLEKAMQEDRNKQRLLIKAFGCQAQIRQMMDEFRDIFSGGYRAYFPDSGRFAEGLNELFRAVHTFKGDFAQYGFMTASDRLHKFEDSLLAVVNRGEEATMTDVEQIMTGAQPNAMLEDDLKIIYEALGSDYFDRSEVLSLPKSKVTQIEDLIRTSAEPLDKTSVLGLVGSLKLKNIKTYLEQYRDYLLYLSGRMMKNMPLYLIEGDDVYIDGDRYAAFIKSLVHIFRNIMDHAIESDEDRLLCGKEERGLVECTVSLLDGRRFSLRIADDGRGIDLDQVKAKALERNLYPAGELDRMTKDELCRLIFADRLSTKEKADMISGRGMGMSAFYETCSALGGTIVVSTERGKGTSFLITLPYTDAIRG